MMSMSMAEIHMKAVRNNNSKISVRGSAETLRKGGGSEREKLISIISKRVKFIIPEGLC